MEIHVKDIIGPLPGDASCFAILSSSCRAIAVQCDYGDAETCKDLLTGTFRQGPNPYDLFVDMITLLGFSVEKVELEFVNDIKLFGKISFSKQESDPMKIVTANPMYVINWALASKTAITLKSIPDNILDVSNEYIALKDMIGQLFPLPSLTTNETLRVVSEFVDVAQASKKFV